MLTLGAAITIAQTDARIKTTFENCICRSVLDVFFFFCGVFGWNFSLSLLVMCLSFICGPMSVHK
jgi:hypothetical protein